MMKMVKLSTLLVKTLCAFDNGDKIINIINEESKST